MVRAIKSVLMGVLLISLVLPGVAATAPADLAELLFDPEIVTRVVKIETFSEVSQKKISGSGFILSQKLVTPLIRVFFLITNKHLVSDWQPSDLTVNRYNNYLDVYFYGNDATVLAHPKRIPLFDTDGNFRDDIVHVHDDASVDIAVIYLHEDLSSTDGIALDAFDSNYLKPFNTITDSGIARGDRVLVLGHPQETPSTANGLPVATVGFLASVPGDMATITSPCKARKNENTGVLDQSGKIMIIEGLTGPGKRSGPVILPSVMTTQTDPDTKTVHHQAETDGNMVIGILSGGFGERGLSYGFSSDAIMEVIFQFLENRGVTRLPRWPEARPEQE